MARTNAPAGLVAHSMSQNCNIIWREACRPKNDAFRGGEDGFRGRGLLHPRRKLFEQSHRVSGCPGGNECAVLAGELLVGDVEMRPGAVFDEVLQQGSGMG